MKGEETCTLQKMPNIFVSVSDIADCFLNKKIEDGKS